MHCTFKIFIRNEITQYKLLLLAPIIEQEVLKQDICKTIHENHKKHFKYLTKLLNFETIDQLFYNLRLFFRASEHNFSPNKFHELCDGKGPTITIIRSTSKNLFGGYASISWNLDQYSSAPGSFIFSLDKQTKHTIYRNVDKAIGGWKTCGPMFGGGEGCDLALSDERYPKAPNWGGLGGSYSLPEGISFNSEEGNSYFAGAYTFGVEEYEVFGVKMN